jgi:hypothetical protein
MKLDSGNWEYWQIRETGEITMYRFCSLGVFERVQRRLFEIHLHESTGVLVQINYWLFDFQAQKLKP